MTWYIEKFRINEISENYGTLGENVKVAVLDTGLSENRKYFLSNVTGWNFIDDNDNYTSISEKHGNATAGIIGAYGDDYQGISPKVELYIGKFFSKKNPTSTTLKALEAAIDKLIELDVDIVSLSYGFLDQPSKSLKDKIEKLASKSLVLCSVGNDNKIDINDRYPASFNGTIGVGACNKQNNVGKKSTRTVNVDLLGPGEEMKVLDINNNVDIKLKSGTSYSTPFVAGVIALLLSYLKANKKQYTTAEIKKVLFETCTKINADKNLCGNGIINPKKMFETFKN